MGFVVNNAAGMGINSHPPSPFLLPIPSCLHRLWQPRTNILIVNSILIVKSTFSASLQHHLFRNLKYLWSSMLLGFHSRKHLQSMPLSLYVTFFRSELVWLLAAFTCHDDLAG